MGCGGLGLRVHRYALGPYNLWVLHWLDYMDI
jgi:hypothetical protein